MTGLPGLAGRHWLTGSQSALQEMLRDTARGGAGTNRMMSYITDAAPQTGEATMRAGLHAEVRSCPCPLSSALIFAVASVIMVPAPAYLDRHVYAMASSLF